MGDEKDAEVQFLTDSSALIEALANGHVGAWRWRIDTDILEWTENLTSIHGLPKSAFDGTLQTFRHDIDGEDEARVWASIAAAVKAGTHYRVQYRTAVRDGMKPRWMEAQGDVVEHEGVRYLTGICTDVTERVGLEDELRRRLRQHDGIEALGSFALAQVDFQRIIDFAVRTAAEIFDVPMVKILQLDSHGDRLILQAGIGWKPGLLGSASVAVNSDTQASYTLRNSSPILVNNLATETRFAAPAILLEHDVASGMSVVIAGTGNRPYGVFGVHATEPRQFDEVDANSLVALANIIANSARQFEAMEHQKLLMREIAHRSNNLLQIVSVIATQTFVQGSDPAKAHVVFRDRLAAIARANDLITRSGWSPTRFTSVVEESLAPFRGRFALEGPEILLPPQLCFDLGLVLHELATNGTKYGSLGAETGTVTVSWRIVTDDVEEDEEERHFEMSWEDSVCNPTAATGHGFGNRLQRALIEHKWAGRVAIEADGYFRFFASIPLPD